MSEEKHHILSFFKGFKIFLLLLVLTVITVTAAQYDFGDINFPLAMLIATFKGLLVIFFFMGLEFDSNENRIIFVTSFVFLGIFMFFTYSDLAFRGDVKVEGPFLKPVRASAKIRINKFWIPTEEVLVRGKEVFRQECASCHGMSGKGDGPGGTTMKPPPRNFTLASGWVKGRKPTQVYRTLTTGLNSMPSFPTFAADDRFAVSYYLLSLGPSYPKDTPADYKAIRLNTSKEDGGLSGKIRKKVPIDFAIDRYVTN